MRAPCPVCGIPIDLGGDMHNHPRKVGADFECPHCGNVIVMDSHNPPILHALQKGNSEGENFTDVDNILIPAGEVFSGDAKTDEAADSPSTFAGGGGGAFGGGGAGGSYDGSSPDSAPGDSNVAADSGGDAGDSAASGPDSTDASADSASSTAGDTITDSPADSGGGTDSGDPGGSSDTANS